jgi:hypothetical protein
MVFAQQKRTSFALVIFVEQISVFLSRFINTFGQDRNATFEYTSDDSVTRSLLQSKRNSLQRAFLQNLNPQMKEKVSQSEEEKKFEMSG